MNALHAGLAKWASWAWPHLADHLWQATLFALLAAAATLLLRRGPARARYAVWLLAAAKFVLPPVFFIFLAKQLGLAALFQLADASTSPAQIMIWVAEPISRLTAPATANLDPVRGHQEIYCALTLLWLSGCAALCWRWWHKRRQFARAVKAGRKAYAGREAAALRRVERWMFIGCEIELVISPQVSEPGVWRSWRPVVVLPESIADHLTDAELEAVIMHELIHVQRWDNLASNLQMLLCCLFWFHPAVWLLDRWLLDERERACDEAVIELVGASHIYAASILKVLRFCLGSKVAGVSGAAGSNLQRRIEQIMTHHTDHQRSVWPHVLVSVIAAVLVVFSMAAGLLNRGPVTAQTQLLTQDQPGRVVGGIPGGIPGGVPGGVAGVVQGGIPGGIPGGVPGGIPGGVPGGMPQELADAIEQLKQAPDLPLQFTNTDGAPLTITGASLRAVKRGTLSKKVNGTLTFIADKYLIKPNLTLANNTTQRITGVVVNFTNTESKYKAYTARFRLKIEPHSSFIFGDRLQDLVSLPGNPSLVTAEVVGVEFEDGSHWGELPPPPPPPPPPRSRKAAPPPPPPPPPPKRIP